MSTNNQKAMDAYRVASKRLQALYPTEWKAIYGQERVKVGLPPVNDAAEARRMKTRQAAVKRLSNMSEQDREMVLQQFQKGQS